MPDLTAGRVAQILAVSPSTVHRLRVRGLLTPIGKVGLVDVYSMEDVLTLRAERRANPPKAGRPRVLPQPGDPDYAA